MQPRTPAKEHTMRTLIHRATLTVGLLFVAPFAGQRAQAADWDHVHLTATDTLAAAQWYSKHFGSKPTKAGVFDAIVYGNTTIKFKDGIPDFKGTVGSTVDHIGFSVPDAKAKIEELRKAGVKVLQEVRYSRRGDFYFGFVEDPWGTKIEVIGDNDLQGFHHIHLVVPDHEAAAKWFSDAFGGQVTHFKGISRLPGIRYGDMWLLVSPASEERAGTHDRAVDHIGWKVLDIDGLVKRLESRGVKVTTQPRVAGKVKLAFVEGPGRVKIEIQQVLASPSAANGQERPRDGGWIQLFNGKNLDGWKVKIKGYELGNNFGNTFRVEDGILKVAYDQYEKFDGRFGHLFHEETFSHYRLRVEHRFVGTQSPGGPGWAIRNSGLMLHGQSPESMRKDQDFPVSIEVQLLGGNGNDNRPTANLCTPGTNVVMDGKLVRRHCTNSRSKTYHGEQWVTVEVEVRGNATIRHTIDGEVVFDYEKPQLDERDPDARKLIRNGDKMLHEGTISLQAESHPVEFRKVEILRLKD